MVLLDLIHRQRHFCEDACWRLQVGAAVVFGQLTKSSLVVLDGDGLQHFFRRSGTEVTDIGRSVALVMHEDTEPDLVEFRHQSLSVDGFKVEARADAVDECIGVLEVLWMLIIVADNIRAIVLVCPAVLVGIGVVQLYLQIGIIGAEPADAV